MAFKFICQVEVRFRDCDPMGHANNAVYLTFIEIARFAYWRDVCGGRGWGDVKFIMARVEIDYKLPAEQGDVLDVHIGITGFGRTSFVFEYQILNQRRQLVATARTVQVMYDYAARKPVPVLQEFKDRVSAFEGLAAVNPAVIAPPFWRPWPLGGYDYPSTSSFLLLGHRRQR